MIDYFELWAGKPPAFGVAPATATDVLARSRGEVTEAEDFRRMRDGTRSLVEGGRRCAEVFGAEGNGTLAMGHVKTRPLPHPWLVFDLAALFALSVRTVEDMLFGGIWIVAKAPPGAPAPGTWVRASAVDDLQAEHGNALDLRTGPMGLRSLAWLWQLPACAARRDRLERGEDVAALDPRLETATLDERAALAARGRAVHERFSALGLAPAHAFLDFVPIGPIAFRPGETPGSDPTSYDALVRQFIVRSKRAARLAEIGAPPAMQTATDRMAQEALFDLLTAGVVRMMGSAGLIADALAREIVDKQMSETLPQRDPDGPGSDPRHPGSLPIWAHRARFTLGAITHAIARTGAEPRARWQAVLLAAGVTISES